MNSNILLALLFAACVIHRQTGRLNAFIILPMFAAIIWIVIHIAGGGFRALKYCGEGENDDD